MFGTRIHLLAWLSPLLPRRKSLHEHTSSLMTLNWSDTTFELGYLRTKYANAIYNAKKEARILVWNVLQLLARMQMSDLIPNIHKLVQLLSYQLDPDEIYFVNHSLASECHQECSCLEQTQADDRDMASLSRCNCPPHL